MFSTELDRFILFKDMVLGKFDFKLLFHKAWHHDQHAIQCFKAVADPYLAFNSSFLLGGVVFIFKLFQRAG